MILRIVVPALNIDSVIRLELEVLSVVVNNDSPGKLPPNFGEILLVDIVREISMLSIESITDRLCDVHSIEDVVCIVLQCCCENDHFVVFGHLLDEKLSVRANEELAGTVFFFIKVDQGFV